MAIQDEFKQDLSLFVETGLIAIKQGDEESAKKLFNAVGILDPQNPAKKLGFGLIALHKMDIPNAQKSFTEVISADKNNWRAQSFLALSYILSTLQDGSDQQKIEALKKGSELAKEVLANSKDESDKQLAQSLIDWQTEMVEKMAKPGM